jgi:hypothetical protein
MRQVKQWHLLSFNEHDIEYVRGLECQYEVKDSFKTIEVNAPDGQIYHYAGWNDYGFYITTDNKKQESMLMLKYAGEISLLRVFYVNEGDRYEFS